MSDTTNEEPPEPVEVVVISPKDQARLDREPKRTRVFFSSGDGELSGFFTHEGNGDPVAPEGTSIIDRDAYIAEQQKMQNLELELEDDDDKDDDDKPGKGNNGKGDKDERS